YEGLAAAKSGVLLLAEVPITPVDQVGDGPSVTLQKFDLKERKIDKFLDDVTQFDVSRDGEKLLYKQGGKWAIASLSQPVKPNEGVLATADIQVLTDPKAEWKEMYRESFRLQRAFFYDPSYHGLDLAATERFYEPWVDGLGNRADLNYLFEEIYGNLT